MFKRSLGFFFGALNLAGIWGSIKLVEAGLLKPFLLSFEHWFITPLQLNLAAIFKLGISASIYLAGLPLSLLSLLANRVLQTNSIHLNSVTDALRFFLEKLIPTPSWIGITLVSPASIIPFGDKVIALLHSGDLALSIFLVALVTGVLTSITFSILQQNFPESLEMTLNRRNSIKAYAEIRKLQDSLSRLSFYGLPNSNEAAILAEVSSYLSKLKL